MKQMASSTRQRQHADRAVVAAQHRRQVIEETISTLATLRSKAAEHGLRIESNPKARNGHTRFYKDGFLVAQYWPGNEKLLIGCKVTFTASVEMALQHVIRSLRT